MGLEADRQTFGAASEAAELVEGAFTATPSLWCSRAMVRYRRCFDGSSTDNTEMYNCLIAKGVLPR
ncbi:hypothetical protein B1H15_12495 [Pseudomonas aeruginosa]|nr:hypothetical protein B1H15_12495 [Pseudomonas aeruginosa]